MSWVTPEVKKKSKESERNRMIRKKLNRKQRHNGKVKSQKLIIFKNL